MYVGHIGVYTGILFHSRNNYHHHPIYYYWEDTGIRLIQITSLLNQQMHQ